MMYTKATVEQLLHLLIARLANIPAEKIELGMLLAAKLVEQPVRLRRLLERFRRAHGLLARVHEDHHLVALAHELGDLLECHFVEVALRGRAVWLAFDADEVLLEGHGPEGGVEVEEAAIRVHAEEDGDVDVVGERGTEADDADDGLA